MACLPLLAVLIAGAVAGLVDVPPAAKISPAGDWRLGHVCFLAWTAGLLAYLVEQRRAKLEACPQCGDIVPRDREACAACNTDLPSVAGGHRDFCVNADPFWVGSSAVTGNVCDRLNSRSPCLRSLSCFKFIGTALLCSVRPRWPGYDYAPIMRRGSVRVMISLMPVWLKPL